MSVRISTSLGDLRIRLYTDSCPITTKNFLKLCKIKYYNGCLVHNIQRNFVAETGDPSGKGTGGSSIYKFLYGDQAQYFEHEIRHNLTHSTIGTVSMVSGGQDLNGSQFYITLRDDIDHLDGKYTVFGRVTDGLDTLSKINESSVDRNGRPLKDIRIKNTFVLEDPFDDPPQLVELISDTSPEEKPEAEAHNFGQLEEGSSPDVEELDRAIRAKEAQCSALFLEIIGDIPHSDVKPPDNILFVCRLNPVTTDKDLARAFSRFAKVVSAKVTRDRITDRSLCYGFIKFDTKEGCERAFSKMENAYVNGRRIKIDFCQSISKHRSHYTLGGSGTGSKCGASNSISRHCKGIPSTRKHLLKDVNWRNEVDSVAFEPQLKRGGSESLMRVENERRSESKLHRARDKKPNKHGSCSELKSTASSKGRCGKKGFDLRKERDISSVRYRVHGDRYSNISSIMVSTTSSEREWREIHLNSKDPKQTKLELELEQGHQLDVEGEDFTRIKRQRYPRS